MAHRLVTHELIAVPIGKREHGVYWLRLYEGHLAHVAVVTEVPGNPSFSVTNGISQVATYIQRRFGTRPDQLAVYEIWPRGAAGSDQTVVKRVLFGRSITWTDSSRADIEALVGQRLPALPEHEELYRRVREMGGGVNVEVRRPIFEAVPVSDLPPPQNLFRCQHAGRFRDIVDRMSVPSVSGIDGALEVGQVFFETLTPADIEACPRHAGQWKAIADESVRIIEALGRQDANAYVAEARRSLLPETDRNWLVSLFDDPVVVRGRSYTNGQHRACALRFSGAYQAAIVTEYESLGEESEDWTYEGDG